MVPERPQRLGEGGAVIERFWARTPTLPPATTTNSYALGAREILLVEPATPFDDERRAWLSWARALAGQGRTLRAIFVTHHHIDHVGGAAFLAGELGVPVWAHPWTAAQLGGVDRELHDGEALVLAGPQPQRWEVLHTPGHAPGHLCLHDAARAVAVVGDMVASEGTILIDPSDGDLTQYLAQLRRLATLGAKLALPAHGAPIEAPTPLFEHYVAHRLMREQRVVEALAHAGAAGGTLDSLVEHAYADTPRHIWPLAKRSLASHLEKLERDGRAERGGGTWRTRHA